MNGCVPFNENSRHRVQEHAQKLLHFRDERRAVFQRASKLVVTQLMPLNQVVEILVLGLGRAVHVRGDDQVLTRRSHVERPAAAIKQARTMCVSVSTVQRSWKLTANILDLSRLQVRVIKVRHRNSWAIQLVHA